MPRTPKKNDDVLFNIEESINIPLDYEYKGRQYSSIRVVREPNSSTMIIYTQNDERIASKVTGDALGKIITCLYEGSPIYGSNRYYMDIYAIDDLGKDVDAMKKDLNKFKKSIEETLIEMRRFEVNTDHSKLRSKLDRCLAIMAEK